MRVLFGREIRLRAAVAGGAHCAMMTPPNLPKRKNDAKKNRRLLPLFMLLLIAGGADAQSIKKRSPRPASPVNSNG